MVKQMRNRHFFFLDLFLLPLAAYISFVLRLERFDIEPFWAGYVVFTITAVAAITLIFKQMGVYSRYWHYASVEELLLLIGAVTMATLVAGMISVVILWLLPAAGNLPRSIPFIFLLLALGVTAGPRLAMRTIALYQRSWKMGIPYKNVLIVGAGDAGIMIARELQRNPNLGMIPVGFVDDDSAKQGVQIRGIPVLGKRQDIPRLTAEYDIEQVIIAMPVAPGKVIREIVTICETAQVETKIIPGVYELLDGTVKINQLRDVQIEDLLRRDPVQIEFDAVQKLVAQKRVLITGGGGSIGSELCRQVMRCGPAELILLGHGENSIFEIYHELRRLGGKADQVTAVIADTRFAGRILTIFEQHQPEIVFHAAAHKHVPLMEMNPAEAITNNILGTQNLLDTALAVNVERFVMISTDKAVNPTSIMGASKRVAELLVHRAAEKSGRPYVAVRFGNVLGSRGSVVLTFQKQIAAGGPVTVTDPEMKRFFMTIPEAVQLVLQAAVLGSGGEVFLLDMGEPVKIVDLARDLIELSGLEVGRDIDIKMTGRRPGEKLFEELFVPGEEYHRTRHEKIFIAGNASRFVPDDLETNINSLEGSASRNDKAAILRGLQNLVPEYCPIQSDREKTESTQSTSKSSKSLTQNSSLKPGAVQAH
ncbi:MAG: polysaccharide biosynthesis protein [Chloroflexi bacterium]|nr:polysaccharide biosynthesis protein [Chloroflexota bacterium]